MCRCRIVNCVGGILLGAAVAFAQESQEQAKLLTLIAKIDGKVEFDPKHPKRVIAIDV